MTVSFAGKNGLLGDPVCVAFKHIKSTSTYWFHRYPKVDTAPPFTSTPALPRPSGPAASMIKRLVTLSQTNITNKHICLFVDVTLILIRLIDFALKECSYSGVPDLRNQLLEIKVLGLGYMLNMIYYTFMRSRYVVRN